MKKFTPVLVTWRDAESKDDWSEVDSHTGTLPEIHTLGYVIKYSKESIVVAASRDTVNGMVSMVITIPKAWCLKIRKLKL
jgi:hypothetical protein